MKKPDAPPEATQDIVAQTLKDLTREEIVTAVEASEFHSYFHWDQLRRRPLPPWLPEHSSHEKWWHLLKIRRGFSRKILPIPSTSSRVHYVLTDEILSGLRIVDTSCAGTLDSPVEKIQETHRKRFILRALREEALQSSALEGAVSTRQRAKEVLSSDLVPTNLSDRMVFNNYQAMQYIREFVQQGQPMTKEILTNLHRIVTADTLDDPSDEGRLQTPGEERVVVRSSISGELLHTPPSAADLPEHIDALLKFINASPTDPLHPVIRAIVVHYWVGFLHPFTDGNGRTARALFYYVMMKNKYWMIEFIPLSKHIRESAAQYAKAYLYTETDSNDVTYFIHYHLKIIKRGIEQTHQYIEDKLARRKRFERSHLQHRNVNHRQQALLQHAVAGGLEYTIKTHQHRHGVTYPTARADLLQLADQGLLVVSKRGRAMVFRPAEDLEERLLR